MIKSMQIWFAGFPVKPVRPVEKGMLSDFTFSWQTG
jgi:hypothetical protein